MRSSGIIEVDYVKLRLHFIRLPMSEQMVVSDLGKVGEFIVINIHGKSLLDLLLDVVIYDRVGFSRPRRTEHHARAERIHDIDPTVAPLFPVIKTSREIHRILVRHQTGFLHETFILHIEYIVHQVVLQQAADPGAGHQQTDKSRGQGKEVADSPKAYADRQAQYPSVQQIESCSGTQYHPDPAPGDPFFLDTFRSQTGKSEEYHSKELCPKDGRKKPRRSMKVHQDGICNAYGNLPFV